MSLTPDQILDRIKLKKQVINWRLVAVMSVVMLFLSLFTSGDQKYGTKPSVIESEYIARVHIDGMIFNDQDRLDIIKDLAEDKAIKAVIIHVNSPGGTMVGGESLYYAIRKLSEKKPTVSVMHDMATSGGYMAAIASDRLIARQGTVTGSIGVLMNTFEFSELGEKFGVKFHNFKSSPLKGGPLPTEKLSPEMKAHMQEIVDDMYDVFMTLVSKRRNIPKEQIKILADGRIFTGRKAVQVGLIDEIGDEETALNWLENVKKINPKLKVHTISLEMQKDKLSMFLEYSNNLAYMAQNILKTGQLIFF